MAEMGGTSNSCNLSFVFDETIWAVDLGQFPDRDLAKMGLMGIGSSVRWIVFLSLDPLKFEVQDPKKVANVFNS